jgi:magnesium-protoporphyrin O-methyltransferase
MPSQTPCTCGCVNTFSTKEAEGDLKRYRRDGPDATTQALIDAIRAQQINGASLLDVGGGIGAISLELLAAGLGTSQSIDASEAYVATARSEAARRGFADRATHSFGMLAELKDEIAAADIVTLDKVVCCDPDLPMLLADVTGRARRMVGLVYPRVTWWNRLAARGMAAFGWLTRDTTRWYLHPDAAIDAILGAAGFERRDVERTLVWQVALFVRSPDASSPERGAVTAT